MIVNFLDITFDSCTERYQPYTKPNDTLTYISVNSNHPPNIIKELPDSTSERIFNNATFFYNDVLSASGYKENLT